MLPVDLETLRLAVLTSFARPGAPPNVAELVETCGGDSAAVPRGLRDLAAQRHLVIGADGQVAMAHPFAAIPLGFSVMGRSTLWWGGCAWDSFAMPHLLTDEPDVLVATRCPGCDAALSFVVSRKAAPSGDAVAHFLVPVARMWQDVVYTCRNQRLFCGEPCVADWLASTGQQRGYVMDLRTLWRLAAGWYQGRLERGYIRRDPASATDYLAQVGLTGPFWTA
jgi:Alkylmercury lyase